MKLKPMVRCFADNFMNDDNIVHQTEECSVIDSLAVPSGAEEFGISAMVQEACTSTTALGAMYRPPGTLKPIADFQDLRKYFLRPRSIASGTVITSRARFFFASVNNAALFNSYFPGGTDRLQGVLGLRYTMVFTTQFMATPFHQGVICASAQYAPYRNPLAFDRASESCTATNLPHVVADLSVCTTAVLRVPFLFENDFDGLFSTEYKVLFNLNTLTPTPVPPGQTAASYKVFIHLEDLEFFGATGRFVGQITPQAGRTLKPVEKELDDAHILSDTTHQLSRLAKWVGRGIPALSTFTGPASWFLDAATGGLRGLGFSKPQLQDPLLRTIVHTSANEQCIDLPSATLMVAPFASNHVVVDPSFGGTEVDEMAIQFVATQWSQINVGSLKTSYPIGTAIYATLLSPSHFWFRSNLTLGAPHCNIKPPLLSGATANAFQPSHAMFWASQFNHWRGDLEFRFTFSKTKMHAARVLVGYIPSTTPLDSTVSFINTPEVTVNGPTPFGHSAIFDLKDDNIFTFKVPYECSEAYSLFEESIGGLSMFVMDALLAPTMVVSEVFFVVEVRFVPGVELSKYEGPRWPAHPSGTIYNQAARTLKNVESDMSQFTAGEKFTSVKQMIALPHHSAVIPVPASTTYRCTVMPWFYHRTYPTSVPGILGSAYRKQSFNVGGNVAQCYAYVKGATDLHAYSRHRDGSVQMLAVHTPNLGNQSNITSTWYNSPWSGAARVTDTAGQLHARFPLYATVRRPESGTFNDVIWDPTVSAQANVSSLIPRFPLPRLNIVNANASATTVYYAANAGDDATCGHYMGPPPFVLASTTVGTVYDPDSAGLDV